MSGAQSWPGALRIERVEGLSQNTAYSVTKDRQGFIWIATADGLNRYDGVEMKVYKPDGGRPRTMSGRIIRSAILEDDRENIWFSTDLGVHRFQKKNETFTQYYLKQQNGDSANIFANPLLFESGKVWLASADRGLFVLDTLTRKSQHYPLTLKDAEGNQVQLMYNGVSDSNSTLWFASSNGLLSFDRRELIWRQYFPDHVFYSVAFSRDTLYVSKGRNILRVALKVDHNAGPRYDYVPFVPREGVEQDHIHRVYADSNRNVWTGDERGNVFCKAALSQEFKWMGNINYTGNVRTNYPIYSFYCDPSGIVWIGTYMLGLVKADIHHRTYHVFPDPGSGNATDQLLVNTFYENSPTEMWLGTFQKGIVALNKESGKTRLIELPYSGPQLAYGNSVHLITRDGEGNLWTGCSGYLYVKSKSASSFKAIKIPTTSNALQHPQVWSYAEYNGGWLFGTTVGLYSVTREAGEYVVKHLSWVGQGRIVSIWRSDNQEVWIAFESGGILMIKDIDNPATSERVFDNTNVKAFLYDDNHDLLWICTAGGLIAYHPATKTHKLYGEQDGLSNSYVYAAVQDGDNLWISTNAGLFRATLLSRKSTAFPEASFTNFTTADGLPGNQFNNRASLKAANGDIYFATPNGIVWFDPNKVDRNELSPRVVITDVAVNGKRPDTLVAPGYIKDLQLPYYRNNFYFRFRGIEYSNPGKVHYACKLEGWDSDWIDNGTSNELRYSNLPPGDYVLKVKAANNSLVWNDNPQAIAFTIHPPFWKTWWFFMIVTAMLVASLVWVTRRVAFINLKRKLAEMERQREVDRERQRISREMHDDIGAGLTQITLISEFARNKSTNGHEKELSEIATTSRQLVHNMSEIIWSLSPDNSTLGQLLSYMREQLGKQLEYSGIDYHISFTDDASELVLANGVRRNIMLVTREIVNNSIKHSAASNIHISARLSGNTMLFDIRDDGSGFDVDETYEGNGLKNIRDRIGGLGGSVEITSIPGSGSRFAFSIRI